MRITPSALSIYLLNLTKKPFMYLFEKNSDTKENHSVRSERLYPYIYEIGSPKILYDIENKNRFCNNDGKTADAIVTWAAKPNPIPNAQKMPDFELRRLSFTIIKKSGPGLIKAKVNTIVSVINPVCILLL